MSIRTMAIVAALATTVVACAISPPPVDYSASVLEQQAKFAFDDMSESLNDETRRSELGVALYVTLDPAIQTLSQWTDPETEIQVKKLARVLSNNYAMFERDLYEVLKEKVDGGVRWEVLPPDVFDAVCADLGIEKTKAAFLKGENREAIRRAYEQQDDSIDGVVFAQLIATEDNMGQFIRMKVVLDYVNFARSSIYTAEGSESREISIPHLGPFGKGWNWLLANLDIVPAIPVVGEFARSDSDGARGTSGREYARTPSGGEGSGGSRGPRGRRRETSERGGRRGEDPEPNEGADYAIEIGVGQSKDGMVGFERDEEDWYVVRVPEKGTLTYTVRNNGDSLLGAVNMLNNLQQRVMHLGATGIGHNHTSREVVVEAGKDYFFRVHAYNKTHKTFYRLQVNYEPYF